MAARAAGGGRSAEAVLREALSRFDFAFLGGGEWRIFTTVMFVLRGGRDSLRERDIECGQTTSHGKTWVEVCGPSALKLCP